MQWLKSWLHPDLDERQAEAMTVIPRKLAETSLATKEDVAILRTDLYKAALLIIGLHTATIFGLLKLLLP